MSQLDRPKKLFCKYDTSKLDLCIFSNKSTGFLISERADFIDGLTLEGKRVEYAIGQCIANMIKFTTNLGVMALSKGHIIRKTLVYRIAANYYEQSGSVISFEINFDNGSSEILYSDERLPLHFCLNACCSMILH